MIGEFFIHVNVKRRILKVILLLLVHHIIIELALTHHELLCFVHVLSISHDLLIDWIQVMLSFHLIHIFVVMREGCKLGMDDLHCVTQHIVSLCERSETSQYLIIDTLC
jgi:hypothetical protein